MKKIIGILLVVMLLLTSAAFAEDKVDVLTTIQAQSGILEAVEGGLHLAGRDKDNTRDDYLNTWTILQKNVGDFEWSFDYTPDLCSWNHDKFAFHSCQENEWDTYMLYVSGKEIIAGNYVSGATLTVRKGESQTSDPYGMYDIELVPGTTYSVKIVMEGTSIKVWFAEKTAMTEETLPVIECEVPGDAGAEEYTQKFIPEGDFQIFSWGGNFVLANMEIIEK